MYKSLLKKIKEYDKIVIYRHINPDYDALGSQFGLKTIIDDNFKDKVIYVDGNDQSHYFEKMDISNYTNKPHDLNNYLAIVLDTANLARMDGCLEGAREIIKIDHHIVVESYGDLRIEEPNASSTSELIVEFYRQNKDDLILSKQAAKYLYFGLIADTNRFLYESVTKRTFSCAMTLLETDLSITEIYRAMYVESLEELELKKAIYNRAIQDGRVGYYIIYERDLKDLKISRQKASEKVNLLADIEEFEVWMAITENIENQNFRVSIRSRDVTINTVAAKYRGGGHRLASGATLESLDELPSLLNDLNQAINDYEKE